MHDFFTLFIFLELWNSCVYRWQPSSLTIRNPTNLGSSQKLFFCGFFFLYLSLCGTESPGQTFCPFPWIELVNLEAERKSGMMTGLSNFNLWWSKGVHIPELRMPFSEAPAMFISWRRNDAPGGFSQWDKSNLLGCLLCRHSLGQSRCYCVCINAVLPFLFHVLIF